MLARLGHFRVTLTIEFGCGIPLSDFGRQVQTWIIDRRRVALVRISGSLASYLTDSLKGISPVSTLVCICQIILFIILTTVSMFSAMLGRLLLYFASLGVADDLTSGLYLFALGGLQYSLLPLQTQVIRLFGNI